MIWEFEYSVLIRFELVQIVLENTDYAEACTHSTGNIDIIRLLTFVL